MILSHKRKTPSKTKQKGVFSIAHLCAVEVHAVRNCHAHPSERLVVAEASDLHMLLIQEEPLVTGPLRCINANAHLTHKAKHTKHKTQSTENAKTRKRKTSNRVETSRIVELELHHQHKTTLALVSVRLKIRSSTKTGSGQTQEDVTRPLTFFASPESLLTSSV